MEYSILIHNAEEGGRWGGAGLSVEWRTRGRLVPDPSSNAGTEGTDDAETIPVKFLLVLYSTTLK